LTTYGPANFAYAAKFARKLTKFVAQKGLPSGTLLNVNIPPLKEREIRGVLVTRQGRSVWDDRFDARRDPGKKEYYWLTGALEEVDTDRDVDQRAVRNRYISVTPIQYDLTDYGMLDVMNRWKLEKLR
jgi:5'-nucleotidase